MFQNLGSKEYDQCSVLLVSKTDKLVVYQTTTIFYTLWNNGKLIHMAQEWQAVQFCSCSWVSTYMEEDEAISSSSDLIWNLDWLLLKPGYFLPFSEFKVTINNCWNLLHGINLTVFFCFMFNWVKNNKKRNTKLRNITFVTTLISLINQYKSTLQSWENSSLKYLTEDNLTQTSSIQWSHILDSWANEVHSRN